MSVEMKNNAEKELLRQLGTLSKMMVQHHATNNLAQLVLHDLCSSSFNIDKAAYFVNNPDFKCLKGVAGYEKKDAYLPKRTIWEEEEDFTSHMDRAQFNNQVRAYVTIHFEPTSMQPAHPVAYELAQKLSMKNPQHHVWTLKHDNQGLLVYELNGQAPAVHEHLPDYLHYLGFCQIF